MSKITNEGGLTRSGTGCFKAVPLWQHGRQRVKHSHAMYVDFKVLNNCSNKRPVVTDFVQFDCFKSARNKSFADMGVMNSGWGMCTSVSLQVVCGTNEAPC